ncbi:MAG: prolipoprotein diacylglyceryl transferase [Oscillospiraceae bacterium]|nr:prolipoprotein diacylglyceryl transferase [Oscillospiraceae bacterium]
MLKHELLFPKLGLSFNFSSVAFSIFGLDIYWYGIIVMCAMLVAICYIFLRAKRFNINADALTSIITWVIVGGVIGARLYYIIFNHKNIHTFFEAINIRNGGIAIYGGLIGGGLAMVATAKVKKVKLLPLLDLMAGGVIIAQAIGRWGNFFNMEAFGCNTDLPWGMTSLPIKRMLGALQAAGVDVNPDLPVHPCFLYESVWCLLGFVFIAAYSKRKKFDGELFAIYILWYSFGRFFIEGLRTDSLMLGNVRISQAVSLLLFVFAGVTLWYKNKKLKQES